MKEEIGESGAGDVLLPSRRVHSAAKLSLLSRKQGRLPLATVSNRPRLPGGGLPGEEPVQCERAGSGRFTRPGRLPEDSG
jgi:hypothetical protein